MKQYTDETLPIRKRIAIAKAAQRNVNIYADTHPEVFIRQNVITSEIVISWRRDAAQHGNVLDSGSFADLQRRVQRVFPSVGVLWFGFRDNSFQIWGTL